MIVIDGPVEFQIGSPTGEPGRDPKDESAHPVRIGRSFALSSKEVTMKQFRRFDPDFGKLIRLDERAPDDHCPAITVKWDEAAQYCQWLSKQEGIPEADWCYPPDVPIAMGMKLPEDFLDRTGYRLPTEAEWELACRAGTSSPFSFGNNADMLVHYARYVTNSGGHTWPVGSLKPNAIGLFDMHGNVQEWCHDIYWLETEPNDTGETEPLRERYQNATRGGSFSSMAYELRSANRRGDHPTTTFSFQSGFRIARTLARYSN
jgi:formylglycine-generating enzyme required for sulfatase activity